MLGILTLASVGQKLSQCSSTLLLVLLKTFSGDKVLVGVLQMAVNKLFFIHKGPNASIRAKLVN